MLTVMFCYTAEAVTLGTGTLLVGQSTTTPSYLDPLFCLLVRRLWPFATLAMYIERSERGAKDPYGSSARSTAQAVSGREKGSEHLSGHDPSLLIML